MFNTDWWNEGDVRLNGIREMKTLSAGEVEFTGTEDALTLLTIDITTWFNRPSCKESMPVFTTVANPDAHASVSHTMLVSKWSRVQYRNLHPTLYLVQFEDTASFNDSAMDIGGGNYIQVDNVSLYITDKLYEEHKHNMFKHSVVPAN